MSNIIIAPVGNNLKALFVGLRDFQAEQVILLSPTNKIGEARKAKNQLEKFHIPCSIMEIKGNIWDDMFVKIAEIKAGQPDKEIIVNTATGDRTSMCAATSAAFVNGLKAFSVEDNQPMLLPILKFSYYKVLSEKKLELLKILSEPECCASLEELSKRTKMSLPLISYHINGNLKSEGLKDLGLIVTQERNGRVMATISTMGKMLLKGYIKP